MRAVVGMHFNNDKCHLLAERGTVRRLLNLRGRALFFSMNLFCVVSENHSLFLGWMCERERKREMCKSDTVLNL